MHPTSILKGIIKIKMVTGTEAEAAVTSAVAERSHSSKIKAQPKRRRTLPDLDPEARPLSAALGAAPRPCQCHRRHE